MAGIDTFDYLISHHTNNSVEEGVNREDLKTAFVVRDELRNKYMVFSSESKFWKCYKTVNPKHFHEVVFGWKPQKLKFDIDFVTDNVGERDEVILFVKTKFIDAIVDELYTSFFEKNKIYPSRQDINVCSSNGEVDGKMKVSYHLVVSTYGVENVKVAREFFHRVIKRVPDKYKQMIDSQVYKETQNFRIVGSSKVGSTRVKHVVTDWDTDTEMKNSIITATPGMRILEADIETEKTTPKNFEDLMDERIDIQGILKLLEQRGYLEYHQFREVRNNLMLFDRIGSSMCNICHRIHDKDNTLMISIEGNKLVERCRHNKNEMNIIQELEGEEERETIGSVIARVNEAEPMRNRFEQLSDDQKMIYESPELREYPLADSLIVKAPMKMGKTKMIKRYIDQYFSSTVEKQKIIFVTFRQTFSSNLKEKLPDFLLYSDAKGDIDFEDNPKVIVQLESLYRVKHQAYASPAKLVVLDEVESIIEQFNSGLHKQFEATFAMFYWLLSTSDHVVCMDANISDRTYKMLEVLRKDKKMFYYCNYYPRARDDIYEFTFDRGRWTFKMFEQLDQGKKIVVAVNSLTEARIINKLVKEKKPDLVVAFYSSETSQKVKAKDFADVNEAWEAVDVLIYTPTITAGVSFERDHFDELFGLFVDRSCPVEVCQQMIGRVRNIQKYTICFDCSRKNLPTETEKIKQIIYDSRRSLFRFIEGQPFSYDTNGNIHFYKSDYFEIWLETMRLKNLSKNDFAFRFISYVKQNGATFSELHVEGSMNVERAKTKKQIKTEYCKMLTETPDITLETAAQIRCDIEHCSPEEHLQLKRFDLRRLYDWHDEMNEKFIQTYDSSTTRTIFRNLRRIFSFPTMERSLEEIRKSELSRYQMLITMRTDKNAPALEGMDLQKPYAYDRLNVGCNILTKLGFTHVIDDNAIEKQEFNERLLEVIRFVSPQVDSIAFHLSISKPTIVDLKYINKILKIMLGVTIEVNQYDFYFIHQKKIRKLFSFNADDRAKPRVVTEENYINRREDNIIDITIEDNIEEELAFLEEI